MPSTVPAEVRPDWSATCAIPKSASFALPEASNSTFAGFRSRWRTPCAWAIGEPGGDVPGGPVGLLVGQGPAGEPLFERPAREVLEGHERPLAGLAVVVERGDVRVRERADGVRLAPEPPRVGLAREQLDRHLPVELEVGRGPDLGRLPAAEPLVEPVAAGDDLVAHAGSVCRRWRRSFRSPRRRRSCSGARARLPRRRCRSPRPRAASWPSRRARSSTCRRSGTRRWTAMPSAPRTRRESCRSSIGSLPARPRRGRSRPARRWESRPAGSSPTARMP